MKDILLAIKDYITLGFQLQDFSKIITLCTDGEAILAGKVKGCFGRALKFLIKHKLLGKIRHIHCIQHCLELDSKNSKKTSL